MALIDWAIVQHGVDGSRVYATGASNSGQMVLRLGLEASDGIAAIAPHVAQMAKNSECVDQGGALPIYIHWGTEDPLTDPDGGCLSASGGGCTRPSDGVTLTQQRFQASASQASDDDRVVFVQAANQGGHWVPGPVAPSAPAQFIKGNKSRDVSSAEEVYAFIEPFQSEGQAPQVPLLSPVGAGLLATALFGFGWFALEQRAVAVDRKYRASSGFQA